MDEIPPTPIEESEQLRIALEKFFGEFGTKSECIFPDGSIETSYQIVFVVDALENQDSEPAWPQSDIYFNVPMLRCRWFPYL